MVSINGEKRFCNSKAYFKKMSILDSLASARTLMWRASNSIFSKKSTAAITRKPSLVPGQARPPKISPYFSVVSVLK